MEEEYSARKILCEEKFRKKGDGSSFVLPSDGSEVSHTPEGAHYG
jgi:hypothetical protein